jgi:hypothetical chaperone protein
VAARFRPEVYAIDFGTSNSLLAAANRQQVHPPVPVDPNAMDPTVLRSVLLYTTGGECFLGAEALQQYVASGLQGRLMRSLKRFLPNRDEVTTMIGSRRLRLEALIAALLRTMRERANAYFECDIGHVCLGRPARFSTDPELDQLAEHRLAQAARTAGFETVEFCYEPVAAARDFQDELSSPKLVLIADLGGGTSDFSVVRMSATVFRTEDVLSTSGVTIAGDALDGALMRQHIARHFGSEVRYRVPFGNNDLQMPTPLMELLCSPATMSLLQQRDVITFLKSIRSGALTAEDREPVERLLSVAEDGLGFSIFEAIEAVKRTLSHADEGVFEFEYPGIDLRETITRPEFERATEPAVMAILGAMDEALSLAGVDAGQIELVCLTGGTGYVPRLQNALIERFGAHRLHRLKGFHSVAMGLAQHARVRLHRD